MNFNFVLISIPGSKNSADKPSDHPNYAQDIYVPTSYIILQGTLYLVPPSLTKYLFSLIILNVLFASITRMATIIAPKADT